MNRAMTWPQLAADVTIAVLFGLFDWLVQASSASWATAIVLVLTVIALGLRRLSPGIALAVAWIAAIVQMVLRADAPSFADVAILGVLYATAAYGGRVVRWAGLASAALGAVVATLYLVVIPLITGVTSADFVDVVRSILFPFFGLLAVLGLSWTLGFLVRTYRRGRDSRRAQSLAEQDVVVEQERNRIARDMHDVVAHSLAVVIAQADGARYAREKDPAAVDAALTTIATTAREALGDVRVLLTQLRHSEGDGPQPELVDLDRLILQFRDSGLEVDRHDIGAPGVLAGGAQLALYRIVQEALTNALRHGATDRPVRLTFDWSGPITVTVNNVIGVGGTNRDGHGLVGMRERAALVGGSLVAERQSDDWVVRATVPA